MICILGGKRTIFRWVSRLGRGGTGDFGQYDERTSPPVIRVIRGLAPIEELDTIIHEGLHGACPYLDEEAVKQSATELARLLWKLGYRREVSHGKEA